MPTRLDFLAVSINFGNKQGLHETATFYIKNRTIDMNTNKRTPGK